MPPSGNRKRQQQICFRSLALPPSAPEEDGKSASAGASAGASASASASASYSPHFLAALQLLAHTMVPLRKALVHFYISYRNKDVTKLEWLTLLAFGRLFRDLITSNSSSGNSVLSGGSGSNSNNPGSIGGASASETDLQPVSSECFFPVLYTSLLKHNLQQTPKDVTEAIFVLIDCLKCCCRTLPVTNQLWSALLDKACLGLIATQTLVGRRKIQSKEQTEVLQRSHTEQVILWCPHVLSIDDVSRINTTNNNNNNNDDQDATATVPSLHQLLEADFKKRPLATTSRSYYDFDKKSFDFEVKIPTKFLDPKEIDDDLNKNNSSTTTDSTTRTEVWKTTRSMQFASLTGYLFLGIDRKPTIAPPPATESEPDTDEPKTVKIDRTELAIPATLDLSKLCSKKKTHQLPKEAIYELVGGALFDEGEYIAVLKDFAAVEDDNDKPAEQDSDDEDETWKLMESEETIPMSESDVLEFLKGEGADDDDSDDDDSDDDDNGPVGTLAIYKLKTPSTGTCVFDEMNQLLSDIVISQVSGSLNSKTDYYIEEEFEEEIIED